MSNLFTNSKCARRALLTALFAASLCLQSCRSSRIGSESKNSVLATRRSEVLEVLSDAESRVDVTAYEAKNAKSSVTMGGKSVNLRANVSFSRGGDTKIAARLVFPPVSVGQVVVSDKCAKVSSKYLDKNPTVKLPACVNDMLQSALLGNLPPVYEYFGDDDFSKFGIFLTADDKYMLTRSERDISVTLGINGEDKTLASIHVIFAGFDARFKVTGYKRFSGKLLPSKIDVSVIQSSDKSATKAEIEISDVTLYTE